ncbi:hypothetical protein M2D07_025890 [Pseudomonas sp. BGr12]|uniref:hypothetical protein n=1 Tax=unclassified Pseudomonas TaxID=196821 RepID=UPI00177D6DD6|nr:MULTISPECIES: hypothetical protein [unclassified Pseudomonas]MBD9500734.1 hypothetical protein [Pseudomonas sp. PDM17]MBD9578994.1 hypothetical protein [Pseudomonas sp. PDM23]MBD9674486.1 hypothetical protein [Pseudomonas sp. PDM21]MDL2430473.1 hypothetical protein [Pseudomonas sp. BJa5]
MTWLDGFVTVLELAGQSLGSAGRPANPHSRQRQAKGSARFLEALSGQPIRSSLVARALQSR